MELDEALNQIEKLEEQIQVAVKMGGDEVLHTVMEIRQNPYEDFEEAANNGNDLTTDIGKSIFKDNLVGGSLAKKSSDSILPSFGAPKPLASSSSTDKLSLKSNFKMNLGLNNKKFQNARSKKNMA